VTKRRFVWAVLACIVLLTVAGELIALAETGAFDVFVFEILAFPIVGALIAARQPQNAVGWIMLGLGVAAAVAEGFAIYAHFGLAGGGEPWPGAAVALALEQHLWVPIIGLPGTFLILLFPDGRLPTRQWRGWAYFCGAALVVVYVVLTIATDSFADSGYPGVQNPLGVDALESMGWILALPALIPIAIVGCAVALIRRFRRASGLERTQLKWLAAAAGVVAASYMVAMVLNFRYGDPDPRWLEVVGNLAVGAFVLIPIAIGIAIFRYRLYDIDAIINRALVYGALTATLTGAYLILVTTLQGLLRPVAGQSALAVAASTLAVAAIFRPARVRIQTLVDRRFYRSKFDAEETMRSFADGLREEIDLETLMRDLLAVVDRTMKPATFSMWVRPEMPRETLD
jgi:hypothetical protein